MKSNVNVLLELRKKKKAIGAGAAGAAIGGAAYGLRKVGQAAKTTSNPDSVSSTLAGGVKDKDELGKLARTAGKKIGAWAKKDDNAFKVAGRHWSKWAKKDDNALKVAGRHWTNAAKNVFKSDD